MLALRRELRGGGYDVVHIHEPVVPIVCWDALCSAGELPLVGTFHTYSENVLTNGIAAVPLGGRRRMNRLHVRIAVSEAAAWTARRFYGGRYRIVPNGVQLGEARRCAAASARRAAPAAHPVRRAGRRTQGPAGAAARVRGAARAVPATLTLVGAAPRRSRT